MADQNFENHSSSNTFRDRVRSSSKHSYNRTVKFIRSKPLGSFFLVLALVLVLLIVGKLLQQKPAESEPQRITKAVQVYSIGNGPKATYQARIDKSGVITIVAQSPGIVQNVSVKEGDKVGQGQQIISLSSNYQGGNAASVQRQIAQRQYQNAIDTFGTQNSLIQSQRDVATASAENEQRTRDITKQSLDETSDLVKANDDQITAIKQSIDMLKQSSTTATSSQQVGELEGSAIQLQSGLNQLRQAQRTSSYQASNENPPALIASAQKDIALKQLDVQQKSIELNRDVAHLQVQLAYVNEAAFYPASPFTGTVQSINVRKGEAVAAGTELATIAADDIESTASLLVPQAIAAMLSTGEPSTIQQKGKTISITPLYVATEASSGQLYAVKYDIPSEYQNLFANGEYVNIEVPLKAADTSSAVPLIPIDAVYQTQDKSFVMVAQNNKAVSRDITVGEVFGDYVEVANGLKRGDQVILNRNVVADDSVKIN